MKLSHLVSTLIAATGIAAGQTHVTPASFGTLPDGSPVQLFTLADRQLSVKVTSFGAHLVSVMAPDRNGKRANVVLGYDSLQGYLDDTSTFTGAIAGRYANRIARGTFSLDGNTYHLPINNPPNSLHGGNKGFDRFNWTARVIPNGVEFTLVSPDGDQGYPGTLTAHVRYTLSGDKLRMDYSATTDKPTVLNLTNHAYFNLAAQGDILAHVIRIHAERYTPVDTTQIPTGELAPVAGTPFDLRRPIPIGAHLDDKNEQITIGGGYDHNFVLDSSSLTTPAASVQDPASGRTLTVYTTEPAVQFYSGNSLKGTTHAPDGRPYARRTGFCLETQHYPDSPNHPAFPTTTLNPGQTFRSTTIYQFNAQK